MTAREANELNCDILTLREMRKLHEIGFYLVISAGKPIALVPSVFERSRKKVRCG